MSFSSLTFLFIFLPFLLVMSWLMSLIRSHRLINFILLALSFFFYAWTSLDSIFLFLIYIIVIYLFGRTISVISTERQSLRITLATLPITGSILLLVFFKYIDDQIPNILHSSINIEFPYGFAAPAGLSFMVFCGISYIVDNYRKPSAESNFVDCALYISFFPKLISGPIVKWNDFRPQLGTRKISAIQVAHGLDLVIIGLSKKVIIADILGTQLAAINSGFYSEGIDIPTSWLRSMLIFFQLYYDFSGYSDIAIGLCKIFGYEITPNFNYPYTSKSITEFWRRWHISLGAWFREYVYIPLGGNRKGNVYFNLFVVFFLTGLWHGDGLTYVLWGLLNAFAVIVERRINDCNWYKTIPSIIKWCLTTIFIIFAWTLFMAPSTSDALLAYKSLFIPMRDSFNFTWQYYLTKRTIILLVIAAIGSAQIVPRVCKLLEERYANWYYPAKRISLSLLFILALIFAVNSSYSPFIYFQF